MFKSHAYDIIPNKRYSYGAVYLVNGVWEPARKLNIKQPKQLKRVWVQ